MEKERRASAVHEPEYQYIIKRLREAREEAGLTQAEVSDALGWSASFVSKCELGERRIDPVDLRKFAELYDRPLEYFYPSVRPQSVPKKRKG